MLEFIAQVGYIAVIWCLVAVVCAAIFIAWRFTQRMKEWAGYWHEEWGSLSREHARLLDKMNKEEAEHEITRSHLEAVQQELWREQSRRRESADVPVLHVQASAPSGVVSQIRSGSTSESVPGVSQAIGQCAPGAPKGFGSNPSFAQYPLYAMDTATGSVRRVPEGADESVPRGPQGGGRERGPTRGGEPAADAPGV